MIKINLIKRRLFFNWLISYLAVLLISTSIISIIYVRVERNIKNEMDRANELYLSKIQKAGDLRLNDMSTIARLVGIDGRVRTLANIKNGFKAENQLDIISVNNFLNTVKISNGFIDQIYIYFRYTGTALSNTSHVDSELGYKLFNGTKTINYEQWLQILNKRYQGVFENNLNINIESDKYNAISFIQSLPVEAATDYTANIVVQISLEKFNDTLRSVAIDDENTVMLVKQDQIISRTNTDYDIDLKKYADLSDTAEVDGKYKSFTDRTNGKKLIVSFMDSEIPGYRYVSVIPYNVYMEKIINSRRIVVIIVIMFIILGAFLSQLIVRKNYNPIDNIIENITKKLGVSWEYHDNELSFIQSVLNNTMDQNDKIVKKMKENADVLRSNFLEGLLKGKVTENEVNEEIMSDFNISFVSRNFAVMLFVIENNDITDNVGRKMYEVNLLHFIITNVVEELINQSHKGMVVELDNSTLACIINISNPDIDNGQFKKDICEIIAKAQLFIEEHFKIHFSASLSNRYNNIDGIPFAYREALSAMKHKAFMGKDNIICYDDVANLENFYDYSAETEYKLMNVIKEGNFTAAKKILEDVFENNFSKSSITLETGECLVFDLLGTLIKVVDDNEVMDRLQPISRLRKCNTVQQIKAETINLLQYICEYFNDKNKAKNEYKISMEVMEFIEKNYNNENLNVSMIGDYFNMTSNYLSRIFKTQANEGLHNYIEKIRIEKAKELMKTEKMSVLEIAKEVGYTNSKTFIRVFKKIEGTTPGKFKELDS